MVLQSVRAGEKNVKSYGEHVTFTDRVEYELKRKTCIRVQRIQDTDEIMTK